MLNSKLFRASHNILNQIIGKRNFAAAQKIQQLSSDHSYGYPAIESISIDDTDNDEIRINWSDGNSSSFPSIYLRDNCNDGKTPNGQRLFETYQLKPDEIKINSVSFQSDSDSDTDNQEQVEEKVINIKWSDESYNTFSAEWLFENSLNEHHRLQRSQRISQDITLWDKQLLPQPNIICSYSEIDENKIPIYAELKRYGVCLMDKAPIKEQYDINNDPPIINIGNTLGFVRETNYGKYFDVRTVPSKDAINLAYTTAGLSVHTDNPYRNPTPGIQLLHCLKQAKTSDISSKEGTSVLIDGFKIAEEMRIHYPEEFELLTTIKRPFTYYDLNGGYKFHKERYVIGLDERGQVESIHFNNRSASCINWNINEDKIKSYYRAWKLFGQLADDTKDKYAIEYRLEPGHVVIFNNNRILHGRNGYIEDACDDDGTGISRHLQGCYIDCDTVWARLDAHQHLEMDRMKRERKMWKMGEMNNV